jgi:hypothetical protein
MIGLVILLVFGFGLFFNKFLADVGFGAILAYIAVMWQSGALGI